MYTHGYAQALGQIHIYTHTRTHAHTHRVTGTYTEYIMYGTPAVDIVALCNTHKLVPPV